MNGQNIPADASCATCRWFRAYDKLFDGTYPADGACFAAPPSIKRDEHYSSRPHVDSDDVCAQWTAQVEP